jgi:predicted transcriptional regulator
MDITGLLLSRLQFAFTFSVAVGKSLTGLKRRFDRAPNNSALTLTSRPSEQAQSLATPMRQLREDRLDPDTTPIVVWRLAARDPLSL